MSFISAKHLKKLKQYWLPLDQHLSCITHCITTATKLEWNYPSNCKFDDDVYLFQEGVNVACKTFSWWLEERMWTYKNIANYEMKKKGIETWYFNETQFTYNEKKIYIW